MQINPFQCDRRESSRNRRSGLPVIQQTKMNVITMITVKSFVVGSTPTVKGNESLYIRSDRGKEASSLQRSSCTDRWSRLAVASDADLLVEWPRCAACSTSLRFLADFSHRVQCPFLSVPSSLRASYAAGICTRRCWSESLEAKDRTILSRDERYLVPQPCSVTLETGERD